MNEVDQENLSRAYADIMNTVSGRLVMSDIMEKFSVTVPVYAFGMKNELADISYRDGQRNAGIYVYNQMVLAAPMISAQLYSDVLIKENERLRIARGKKEDDEPM